MQAIWVPSLRQENPLEKKMATQPSILAWKIPWTEEPSQLQSMGVTVRHDLVPEQARMHTPHLKKKKIKRLYYVIYEDSPTLAFYDWLIVTCTNYCPKEDPDRNALKDHLFLHYTLLVSPTVALTICAAIS